MKAKRQQVIEATPWVHERVRETGLVEHICEHGCGHPATYSVRWFEKQGFKGMGVHGCCGCCSRPEWKKAEKDLQKKFDKCD